MKANYDSQANAISISIVDVDRLDAGDEVHEQAIVGLRNGEPVDIDLLYPDLGIRDPLTAVAKRYALDLEALEAVAQSALAAPDRDVMVEVAGKTPS